VVDKVLLTYGDADRQAEQTNKLRLEGWRQVKDANHGNAGLEIMNVVTQLCSDTHDDVLGAQPDLTGLTRQDLLDAVDELTQNATPETIVELGKALNNGVTLANKTPLKVKPKRGGEMVDIEALSSRFMAECPTRIPDLMAAMASKTLKDFLVKWASSMVEAKPQTGAASFEELLAK
jgi:hypothetical protein